MDDDPGQELMRDTGRFLFFFAGEVEAIERMSTPTKQILVAAIGNMLLRDDGFGGEVVRRLRERSCPTASPWATSAPAGSTSRTR